MNAPIVLPYVVEPESELPKLEVVSQHWLGGDNDPPRLECRISDGSYVQIAWDIEHHCRNLYFAVDKSADYRDATGEETGLEESQLGPLVEEVATATESYWSNLRAEDDGGEADRWEQHGGGGRS